MNHIKALLKASLLWVALALLAAALVTIVDDRRDGPGLLLIGAGLILLGLWAGDDLVSRHRHDQRRLDSDDEGKDS